MFRCALTPALTLAVAALALGGCGGAPGRVAVPACGAGAAEDRCWLSRAQYREQLAGFWLGQSIANWTGLVTEMDRIEAPFYTDADWGQPDQPNMWGNAVPHADTIDFYLDPERGVWGADDDTDIEYLYQHLLEHSASNRLSAQQIRAGWLRHIYSNEDAPGGENFLWVSNERAYYLMREGLLPPVTSEPARNPDSEMIDAQLTTEFFGLLAPGHPDVARGLAYLPIRTAASGPAAQIANFYVTMHALAPLADRTLSRGEQLRWMAAEARKSLEEGDYPAAMYDFVLQAYRDNPDKTDWESTRDAVYRRYQVQGADGYRYRQSFDAGINFAASLVSLFYGEGDLKRTLQIATLAGWDSDNPAATWGGLLGFMLGREGVVAAFGRADLADAYWIHRTRRNFPDHTPGLEGEDTFRGLADRGLALVDRSVTEEIGGALDGAGDRWIIPLPADTGDAVQPRE